MLKIDIFRIDLLATEITNIKTVKDEQEKLFTGWGFIRTPENALLGCKSFRENKKEYYEHIIKSFRKRYRFNNCKENVK